MKFSLQWLGRAFLLIILLVAGGTFIPRPLLKPANAGPAHAFLLLSNPIHTDIAIPLDDTIRARFAFLAKAGVPIDNSGAKYLVVGWGGRSFYLETPHWADIKPLPVFRALTLDNSVMHVEVTGAIQEDDASVTALVTDDEGLARMLAFIQSSFAMRDDKTRPIPAAQYGRHDAFYEANGYFNALVGCNTWTARALREAGLRTGVWNPVPQTLAASLKLYN